MEDFGKALDGKLGRIVKAFTAIGFPGGSAFYVLESSGANDIVTYITTLNFMGLILLSIIVHLQLQRLEEMKNAS